MNEATPLTRTIAANSPGSGLRSQRAIVQAYVAAVVLAGSVVVAFALSQGASAEPATFVGLLIVSVLTSSINISLPLTGSGATPSFSYVASFASLLALGTWPTVLLSAATGLSQGLVRRRPRSQLYHTVFSAATLALSAAGAGIAHQLTIPSNPNPWWPYVGAAATAASAYFVINTNLVSLAVALTSGQPIRPVWRRDFLWSAPSYYIGAGLAVVLVELSQRGLHWWAITFSLPVYMMYRSFRSYSVRIADEQQQVRELADVQLATIEALALAIEAKDRTSQDHLRRMQAYSEGLARAIRLSESEIRGIKTAAMLHDIGNLAVPEHILSKTGQLTDEEYNRLKVHPRVGAEIIRSVPFPYPVASLILAHHERWDGRGYPEGRKGLEIPVGARILAVADCFTAMLSGRPHRQARTYAEAIATLRENGGSALDSTLVERFIEILPDVEYRLHGGRTLAEASRTTGTTDKALIDIAGAHREERMLHNISQALSASLRVSDTLALVSSSMVECVPFVSCALFLYDEESQLFLCRHVAGTQHDGIRAMLATRVESLAEMLPAQPIQGRTPGASGARIQSALAAPLRIGDETIGALVLYHTDRDAFAADQRRLLGRVAAQAASVIANAMVFERTHEQSLTDVLTGLPNRRYLDRQFGQELARAQRQQGRLSLLVLDMDRFKQINDGYGHQAGDRALKEVAQVLRSSLRVYDVCARFAGDEFVVILGDCDPAQAERRRQELQQAIHQLHFEPAPGHAIPLGVSIGVASFPEDAETVDDMLAIADRRMYADKASRKGTSINSDRARGQIWP